MVSVYYGWSVNMQDLTLSSQTLDLSRRAITELPRDLSGYKDLEVSL